jgi:hypothetical protein
METNTPHRRSPYIAIALLIGILATLLIGFLDANPAYASGLIKVSSYNERLDIQFVSASTNDQGTTIDPGQDVHVGQCTAELHNRYINFRVYRGYPDYQCTLSVRLKNLGEQTVRIQSVTARIPEELILTQPALPAGFLLQPEEEVTLDFILQVRQNAEENAKYRFSIQLIFEDFIR